MGGPEASEKGEEHGEGDSGARFILTREFGSESTVEKVLGNGPRKVGLEDGTKPGGSPMGITYTLKTDRGTGNRSQGGRQFTLSLWIGYHINGSTTSCH